MILTDDNFKPEHEKEYRTFLLWRSLPSFLFKLPPDKLDVMNLDDEILNLLQYPTQKQLAEFLKISEQTLSDWNNRPVAKGYEELDWRVWAKRLTKNVVGALYRQCLIDGDAARAKFWFQAVENWKEGFEVDANIRGELEQTRDKLKEIILDEREKAKSDSDEQVVQGERGNDTPDGGTG